MSGLELELEFSFLLQDLNIHGIKKIKLHLYILGLGFLVAVLFSREVNGATRWFSFSGFNMQPSEMAKLIIIIYLAGIIDFCEKRKIRPEKLGFFS